jgi:hypothetical protein
MDDFSKKMLTMNSHKPELIRAMVPCKAPIPVPLLAFELKFRWRWFYGHTTRYTAVLPSICRCFAGLFLTEAEAQIDPHAMLSPMLKIKSSQ